MAKRFKRCILHIGTEKTGTSSVQIFLTQNRKALIKDGILYPETGMAGSQWEFVALTHPNPWGMDVGQALNITDEASRQNFKTLFLENLKRQAAQNPKASTLLISSEHFHSRLGGDTIQDLKTILDEFVESYKILVYLRRQDELAVSHFTTRIKSGYMGTDLALPDVKRKSHYYDYDDLITRWADVFGLRNIQGGLYEHLVKTENGIIDDFCRKCQINLSNKVIPTWYNRSLSAAGLKFIQSVNHIYKHQEGILSAADRQALINWFSAQNEGRFYPISRAQAELFYSRFLESNERVRERLFPNKNAPLFGEDFSYYPEESDILPNDYNAAVIQAVKLWQRPTNEPWLRKHSRRLINFISRKLP